jgi:hypothetical protein
MNKREISINAFQIEELTDIEFIKSARSHKLKDHMNKKQNFNILINIDQLMKH